MLLDLQQEEQSLIVSFFNEEGKVDFKTYDTSNVYNWQVCEPTDKYKSKQFINWDGKPVKKFKGKNLGKHTLTTFLESLPEEDSNKIFGYNFPKIYFFDIETEVTEGFPEPSKAENQVLTISLVTPEQKIIVMGLKDLTPTEQASIASRTNEHFKAFNSNWEFIYKKFNSEYDMVYTFMQTVSKLPMLSGWHCIGFDWQYLINRCRRLQIDPSISSPTRSLTDKTKLPYHVGLIDYKELYVNWDRSISPKENGKLETAAKQVLGMGKIQYDGGLQDLYEKDFETYVYYNAVDSALVYYIDQKLKTMQVVLTLSNICKMSIYKAGSPVAITESIICRNLLKENKVMARNFNESDENKKQGQYTGAFVKDPVVGMHRGVACFDYASLYPSIMRQFNISPDSYIEKLPDNIKDEKREQLKGSKIVTSYGGVYSTEPSILKKVLTDLYSERKKYKKESFSYKMLADSVKQKLKTM
jgi:DNA polymerase elongation subunit (family B)